VLFYVPFAALVSSPPSVDPPRFLVNDYNIAYIPSAAILKQCFQRQRAKRLNGKRKLLAVGNPLGDLPGSETEVKKVASLFDNATLLIGESITRDTILNLLSEDPDVVHFATHAVIDEKSPLFSYLVLGKNDRLSRDLTPVRGLDVIRDNSNLLMAHELFNLNCDHLSLVTLSACQTAGGRLARGEGIIGMTRAFMKAGASSMLTSLWQIDDRAAQKLMTLFYDHWLHKGETKARALRQAQLTLINNLTADKAIKYPHPYLWAPFILTGNFR